MLATSTIRLTLGLTLGWSEPLVWEAPSSCPGVSEIRERVDDVLGWHWEGQETQVVGRVHDDGGTWRLRLELHSGPEVETRTLEGSNCEELSDAAAIVIAAAVRQVAAPVAEVSPRETATDKAARSDDTPEVSTPPLTRDDAATRDGPTPRARQRRPRRPEHGVARLEGGTDFGMVAVVTGGPRLSFGLVWRFVRVEVVGTFWAPRRHELRPGRGARLSAGTVELRGCGRVVSGTAEVPLCAGVEAGASRNRGYGFRTASTGHTPWAAGVFSPSLIWRVHSHVGLVLGAQLWIALVRPQIVSSGDAGPQETIYEVPPVGGRATLGVEFRLAK